MYIQFKEGFIEADRWDGSRIPDADHMRAINRIKPVYILRSRTKAPLEFVNWLLPSSPPIFNTPNWDYEYRVYITSEEFKAVMCRIVDDTDYRNFKSWCAENCDKRHANLAKVIWTGASKLSDKFL